MENYPYITLNSDFMKCSLADKLGSSNCISMGLSNGIRAVDAGEERAGKMQEQPLEELKHLMLKTLKVMDQLLEKTELLTGSRREEEEEEVIHGKDETAPGGGYHSILEEYEETSDDNSYTQPRASTPSSPPSQSSPPSLAPPSQSSPPSLASPSSPPPSLAPPDIKYTSPPPSPTLLESSPPPRAPPSSPSPLLAPLSSPLTPLTPSLSRPPLPPPPPLLGFEDENGETKVRRWLEYKQGTIGRKDVAEHEMNPYGKLLSPSSPPLPLSPSSPPLPPLPPPLPPPPLLLPDLGGGSHERTAMGYKRSIAGKQVPLIEETQDSILGHHEIGLQNNKWAEFKLLGQHRWDKGNNLYPKVDQNQSPLTANPRNLKSVGIKSLLPSAWSSSFTSSPKFTNKSRPTTSSFTDSEDQPISIVAQ